MNRLKKLLRGAGLVLLSSRQPSAVAATEPTTQDVPAPEPDTDETAG